MWKELSLKVSLAVKLGICISLLGGCSTNQPIKESLKSGSNGAVGMLLIDSEVYRKATPKTLDAVTLSLLFSTLDKMAVLKRYEEEIGNGYTIEDDFTVGNANQLCWVNNFLLTHKKDLPSNLDYTSTYAWVDSKQKVLKNRISEYFGDKKAENDCRF